MTDPLAATANYGRLQRPAVSFCSNQYDKYATKAALLDNFVTCHPTPLQLKSRGKPGAAGSLHLVEQRFLRPNGPDKNVTSPAKEAAPDTFGGL
ncbi:MAG: hypothetical protein AB1461_11710 [Thermodesulfobacteriota bacterium]